MNRILIFLLVCLLLNTGSCQTNKTDYMNKNLDLQWLERKAEKTQYEDPENLISYYYEKTEKDGTMVLIQGDREDGFTESRINKDSYYELYKEYYPTGIIKESGKLFGRNTPIGIWNYFDEQGNLIKEVDKDKKFGSFDCMKIIDFLIEKKYIEEDTYKGIFKLTINFSEDTMAWYIRVINPGYLIEDYIIDGNTGVIKSHETFQGGKM